MMRGVFAKIVWFFLFIAFVGAFLLVDASGLMGLGAVTSSTVVAKVNGDEISYIVWQNLSQSLAQQQEQQSARSLNLDERRQIEDEAFNQLVSDLLLQQEYEKRGIRVTDAEIRDAALYSPPQQMYSNPDLQTDGRFDPTKYQRLLSSPVARQQGLLLQLENYYRAELPRTKLFSQLISDAWVSDERLFRLYRDESDTATVQFIALRPTPAQIASAAVSDADALAYYEQYDDRWERAGRAVVSVTSVSRIANAADTASVESRVRALRAEIESGRTSFEDVARRESEDTISGPQGGDLGRGARGRFVPEFEDAAFALRVGQVSQPTLTQFGWHLIKATEKKGDTLALRHILLSVKQSDSAASQTDRLADRLSVMAGGVSEDEKFDSAAAELGLLVTQITVTEDQTAFYLGRQVGGISGWAFSGPTPGETSDLIDDDAGYYLVRLDSITKGGKQPFELVKDEILTALKERKAAEGLMAQGEALLADARSTSLAAAASKAGLTVESAPAFTRTGFVVGLGYYNEAVGASFAIPVGSFGVARTHEGVFVINVVSRTEATREAFEAQKESQRERTMQALREQKVRLFLDNLRREAKIVDRRQDINAMLRRQSVL